VNRIMENDLPAGAPSARTLPIRLDYSPDLLDAVHAFGRAAEHLVDQLLAEAADGAELPAGLRDALEPYRVGLLASGAVVGADLHVAHLLVGDILGQAIEGKVA
jgi:hypothetical protein